MKAPDPHWFRRLNHTAAAAIIVYFLLPEMILDFLPRWALLLAVLLVPLTVELVRLRKGGTFMGLREYEKGRLSSYMWFNISAVVLLLASEAGMPQAIAAGCIVLAAMVDPLLGELKPRDRSLAMVAGVVAATFILVIFDIQWYYALLAAAAAVWAEQFNLKQLDDDMLMQFAPALVLIIFWLVGETGAIQEMGGVSFESFGGD